MKSIQELTNLSGKSAIITGGSKGIGYGIARRLAEAGASVLIADIDLETAKKTAIEFVQNGWEAEAIGTDVSDEEAVKTMVRHCLSSFDKIDILVNNAGIFPAIKLADMGVEQFEKVIHTNLRSVFLTTKHTAEAMKLAGNGGKIINITSIDALHPSMVGLAHYDASKHGVWGFTKNTALELAPHKIWVNAIAPGGILTPGVQAMQSSDAPEKQNASKNVEDFLTKIPMHRLGEPDEIGTVALFLASDMSSYITGEQIVVDGGALLS